MLQLFHIAQSQEMPVRSCASIDMWQVPDGKRVKMRFFYRREHFDAPDEPPANSLGERELLWSDNVAVNKPGSIEGCARFFSPFRRQNRLNALCFDS